MDFRRPQGSYAYARAALPHLPQSSIGASHRPADRSRAKERCMGLTIMILGLALLLGVHLFTTMRDRRAALVARLGEGPYKGLYSLISLIGLALIVYGFARYRQGEWIDIW